MKLIIILMISCASFLSVQSRVLEDIDGWAQQGIAEGQLQLTQRQLAQEAIAEALDRILHPGYYGPKESKRSEIFKKYNKARVLMGKRSKHGQPETTDFSGSNY